MSTTAARSDLGVRTGVGAALIVVALGALWLGGIAFWVLLSVACLLMLAEWADLMGSPARDKRIALFALSAALAILSPLAAGPGFFELGLIAGMAFFATIVTRDARLGGGLLYAAVPGIALVWLRGLDQGLLLTAFALAVVWATDIGAYFAGRAIGGPKLAPAISPSKTWAGLAGGMVGGLLLGMALKRWAGLPDVLAYAAPLLAVLAQAGDLYESWLKRRAGVKDSGTILPGHGGVLDRLDGVVPVAPAVAALVALGWAG